MERPMMKPGIATSWKTLMIFMQPSSFLTPDSPKRIQVPKEI